MEERTAGSMTPAVVPPLHLPFMVNTHPMPHLLNHAAYHEVPLPNYCVKIWGMMDGAEDTLKLEEKSTVKISMTAITKMP